MSDAGYVKYMYNNIIILSDDDKACVGFAILHLLYPVKRKWL